MNDLRNIGNVNAVLATSTFNQHDRLVDEFIHRLFRLAGEEAPTVLSDVYFNEAGVMRELDSILDELPVPDSDISPPIDFSVHYRRLLQSIRAVIDEDQVARQLLQRPHEEDSAIRSGRASSSSEEDDTSDDDPLEASPVNNESDDGLEYTDGEGDSTVIPATGAAHDTDKLIDDEAEEMPEGYVSNEGPGEDEETSGSETGTESSGSGDDDSESDSTPPPATPGSIEEADEL